MKVLEQIYYNLNILINLLINYIVMMLILVILHIITQQFQNLILLNNYQL